MPKVCWGPATAWTSLIKNLGSESQQFKVKRNCRNFQFTLLLTSINSISSWENYWKKAFREKSLLHDSRTTIRGTSSKNQIAHLSQRHQHCISVWFSDELEAGWHRRSWSGAFALSGEKWAIVIHTSGVIDIGLVSYLATDSHISRYHQ